MAGGSGTAGGDRGVTWWVTDGRDTKSTAG